MKGEQFRTGNVCVQPVSSPDEGTYRDWMLGRGGLKPGFYLSF